MNSIAYVTQRELLRHSRHELPEGPREGKLCPCPVTITDLLKREFTASRPDDRSCVDFKQIGPVEGALILSSFEDLFDRCLVGFAFSDTYATADSRRP
jgi:hypothetical protein